MNRIAKRTLLALGPALVGLFLATGGASAQTKSLKQQIEGTWTLEKAFDTSSDGKDNDTWGPGVAGSLTLDPWGHFSFFLVSANRDKSGTGGPRVPVGQMVAHYGTYTIDEGAKKIVYHYANSSFPQWDGVERTASIQKLTGTELSLETSAVPDPKLGTIVPHQVFKRAN